jgi:hypothetical protein
MDSEEESGLKQNRYRYVNDNKHFGSNNMKQSDAVFQAVCSVLEQGEFSVAVELTKQQRDSVVGMVTAGILNGSVDFSTEAKAKHDTEAKVKVYTNGMVSNHLRKDKRLNGGKKYEAKNPGSRTGNDDEQLKALRTLKSTLTSTEDIEAIDQAIKTRLAEIQSVKAKPTAPININALPEEFRHLAK